MISDFKGLSTDSSLMDLVSSSYFNHEAPHDLDAGSIFLPASFDSYSAMTEDIHSSHLFASLNQDINKAFVSPKTEFHPLIGNAIHQRSLLGKRPDLEGFEETKMDKDDEGSDSESVSDSDSAKKRGKYRTYTDDEKNHIISFMLKHGTQKTLEIFSGGEHKITKRKLKSWIDSQHKIKGVKGRKSNDPSRDQALHRWCMDFQNEHGRPPSRKEATQKALELSGDPNFQASKGWLDKFSRKYNIEFTPLKIIPPRGRKKVKTDSDSGSATSTRDSTLLESISPLKDTKARPLEMEAKKFNSTPIFEEITHERENALKVNPLYNLNVNANPIYQQTQQQSQLYSQIPVNSMEGGLSSLEHSYYQPFSTMESGQSQGFGYPLHYVDYSMAYPLNYQTGYPASCGKPYPMNYQMNIPMNYQAGFAGNLQRLQHMISKGNEMK
jgi:hypothetical protein